MVSVEAGNIGYEDGYGHTSNIQYNTHHEYHPPPPPVHQYHGGAHSYMAYTDHSAHYGGDIAYYAGNNGYNTIDHSEHQPYHNNYNYGGSNHYSHNEYDESLNHNVSVLIMKFK